MIALMVYAILLCVTLIAVALTASIGKGEDDGDEKTQDQRKDHD